MYLFAHICMHICVHMRVEAWGRHRVSSSATFHPPFWDELSHWCGAYSGCSGVLPCPISSSLERQAQSTMISCFVGARNSNSGPQLRASALPAQSSSQPLRFYKLTFSCFFFLLLCFSLLVALGIEPRALYLLSKHSTTKLCPQSYSDLSLQVTAKMRLEIHCRA